MSNSSLSVPELKGVLEVSRDFLVKKVSASCIVEISGVLKMELTESERELYEEFKWLEEFIFGKKNKREKQRQEEINILRRDIEAYYERKEKFIIWWEGRLKEMYKREEEIMKKLNKLEEEMEYQEEEWYDDEEEEK